MKGGRGEGEGEGGGGEEGERAQRGVDFSHWPGAWDGAVACTSQERAGFFEFLSATRVTQRLFLITSSIFL